MLKPSLLGLTLLGVICLMAHASPARAQTAKDELDYSASMCTPRNAGQFHGSDAEGFTWDERGYWVNRDEDENQQLVCPIPFDRRAVQDGAFGTIEIRVNVVDSSHLHELTAEVFGKVTTGDPLNDAAVLLASAFTSNRFTGARTLLLSATPGNDIRYLWLKIDVPREVYPAKRSAVIGYRINRVGFN